MKSFSWPINLCLKYFMAPTQTLRPPLLLHVQSLVDSISMCTCRSENSRILEKKQSENVNCITEYPMFEAAILTHWTLLTISFVKKQENAFGNWMDFRIRIGKAFIQMIMLHCQIIWRLDNWLVRHATQY